MPSLKPLAGGLGRFPPFKAPVHSLLATQPVGEYSGPSFQARSEDDKSIIIVAL